jgi:predicted nucleic acid-binding protein
MTAAIEDYLLCTNIVSILWNTADPRHDEAIRKVSALDPNHVHMAIISVSEVEYGLKAAPLRSTRGRPVSPEKQSQVREQMRVFKKYYVTESTCEVYGEIKTALMDKWARHPNGSFKRVKRVEDLVEPINAKDLGIEEADLWIVSIAKDHNLIFVTNDSDEGMKRVVDAANYGNRTQFWRF